MERWLNTRTALIAAWSIIGALVLSAAAFAAYVLIPLARGGNDDGDPALASGTVAPVATATQPAGRAQLTGTVEKVEGQALIVRIGGEERARVLLRRDATVGRSYETSLGDIRAGDAAVVSVVMQSDGRLVGSRVRLQPASVPVVALSGPGGATLNPQTVGGTVISLEATRLRLQTSSGERQIDLGSATGVSRFMPISLAELIPGQRVRIDGEYLVDGSFAALTVLVFGAR